MQAEFVSMSVVIESQKDGWLGGFLMPLELEDLTAEFRRPAANSFSFPVFFSHLIIIIIFFQSVKHF